MKKRYIFALTAAAILIWLTGIYTGYAVYGGKVNKEMPAEENISADPEYEAKEAASTEEKVLPITKMTYKYEYPDGSSEVKESEAPNFLLGKTMSEVSEIMSEWNVEKFSEKNIVLSKSSQRDEGKRYIVSSYNGFVAAFMNDKSEKNLIEVTSTPVASLLPDERENIERGIVLGSRYELSRCIENYGS